MILNKSTKCLTWPAHQQTCWLPFHDIIYSISVPKMHGSSGDIKNLAMKNAANFVKLLKNIKHKLNVINTAAYY